MSALLSKVESLASARQTERAERYRQLVLTVADGAEPDPAETVDVLEQAGKTPSDLNSDLQTIARRRALAAEIAAGKLAVADREAVTRQIDDANAAFQLVQQTHAQTIGELNNELHRLIAIETAGRTASTDLERTAPDSLKRQLQQTVSWREALQKQFNEAHTEATRAAQRFEHVNANRTRTRTAFGWTKQTPELETVSEPELARLKAQKEATESRLENARTRLDSATAEEAAIRAKLRETDVF